MHCFSFKMKSLSLPLSPFLLLLVFFLQLAVTLGEVARFDNFPPSLYFKNGLNQCVKEHKVNYCLNLIINVRHCCVVLSLHHHHQYQHFQIDDFFSIIFIIIFRPVNILIIIIIIIIINMKLWKKKFYKYSINLYINMF